MHDAFKSTVKLPAQRPKGVETVFDFFIRRFPRISASEWRARFAKQKVFTASGPLNTEDDFTPLLEVHYFREVEKEHPVRKDYRIVHQDAELLVVDKPPFLPVTPSGAYVHNCLWRLLIEATGNRQLTPLHRVDKDAAGLIAFAQRSSTRGRLARLFHPPFSQLDKSYLALCELGDRAPPPWLRLRHHLARSPDAYHLQQVFPGRPANSICEAVLLERRGNCALFRLRPQTGRKHQLRRQLSSAGLPLINDSLYGSKPSYDPQDLTQPLGLICHQLALHNLPKDWEPALQNVKWRSHFNEDWLWQLTA